MIILYSVGHEKATAQNVDTKSTVSGMPF